MDMDIDIDIDIERYVLRLKLSVPAYARSLDEQSRDDSNRGRRH